MILYHGTYVDFDVIDLAMSSRGKDFGKGFYLSDSYEQAYEMAVFKAVQFGTNPIVQTYDFDESLLGDGSLNYLGFDDYNLEWAEFILNNRSNGSNRNIHKYDVIYGPIADDRVGVQIRNLMEQNIDMDVFLKRLRYMRGITFQYFFGTDRAISKLIRV